MGADVAAECPRLLDRGLDLGYRELKAVERIVGRGDTARHHDLHLVAALPHFLADRLLHLRDAVGQAHGEGERVAAVAAHARIGPPAAIAVPAGRAERLAGDEQPGTRAKPLLDRGLDPPVGAAGVAYGREAALQHAAHQVHCACRHQGQRDALEPAECHLAQHDVDVAIDQARHQGPPAAVDDLGRARRNRPIRHLLDEPVLDQQLEPALEPVPLRVQHLKVSKEVLGQARSPGHACALRCRESQNQMRGPVNSGQAGSGAARNPAWPATSSGRKRCAGAW